MTPHQKRINPFIQRMAEDMQLRNLADSTIDAYTYHVDKFCRHFGKPADQLGPEEIRQYQLYLVNDKKASWSSFNQAVCGLRFLYEVTLQRPWEVRHIPFGKRPKKLPVVLSDEEASRLFQCMHNPKHRAVLLTCYAAGLRVREATHRRSLGASACGLDAPYKKPAFLSFPRRREPRRIIHIDSRRRGNDDVISEVGWVEDRISTWQGHV